MENSSNKFRFDSCILATFKQGQKKLGVEEGPNFLLKLLEEIVPQEKLIYANPNFCDRFEAQDYKDLYDLLNKSGKCLTLGGDHSTGQSTVASSIYKMLNPNDLYVIWIDAHADTNTEQSSPSKNKHGMPLAGLLGVRDADLYEDEVIDKYNIFSTCDANEMLRKIREVTQSNSNAKFHISFDVDALDPSFLDSTGTPAANGLSPNDVVTIINEVIESIISFDISEFNPLLGNLENSLKTMKQIFEGIKWNYSKEEQSLL